MYLNNYIKNLCIILFALISITLFFLSFNKFPGLKLIFISFFLVSNFYLFYSFKFSLLFLDKTLSVFLWLGFFYKLSILLITNSNLPEGAGNFSYLPNQYNELLIYSSIGILGFLSSSFIFQKYLSNFLNLNTKLNKNHEKILIYFFDKYKIILCLFFLFLILFITIINFKFGFYQKGLLPKNEINLYFGYFIKWMLLFGLTSISCVLIEYDIKSYNNLTLPVIILFFLELLMTNVSLLSRSLIFTGSAILAAIYFNYNNSINKEKINNSLIVNSIILFIIFSISIFPINKIRNYSFIDQSFIAEKIVEQNIKQKNKLSKNKIEDLVKLETNEKSEVKELINSNLKKEEKIELLKEKLEATGIQDLNFKENVERILFVIKNRFVGLDGVATVTSFPKKNFQLFINSLKESYNSNEYGFYQKTFIIPFEQKHLIGKEYQKTSERHYGVILPGIISYLSYPGSKFFLFLSSFIVFLFCGIFESAAKKYSYNSIIFSSLVGYVLGYRLVHFGYMPKQSYLLLGAIILTIFFIKIIKFLIIKFSYANQKN